MEKSNSDLKELDIQGSDKDAKISFNKIHRLNLNKKDTG